VTKLRKEVFTHAEQKYYAQFKRAATDCIKSILYRLRINIEIGIAIGIVLVLISFIAVKIKTKQNKASFIIIKIVSPYLSKSSSFSSS